MYHTSPVHAAQDRGAQPKLCFPQMVASEREAVKENFASWDYLL
jgi:hypothetical protein